MKSPPLFALIVLGLATPAFAAEPETSPSPWRMLVELRFSEAYAGFVEAAKTTASPETRLGTAITLLGTQPRTEAKIVASETLFAELMQSPDPDIAARAAYLHARIPHVHRQSTDWEESARRYLAAYQAHPAHALGQRALVRHGLVTLLRPMPEPVLRERLEAFLEMSAQLNDPLALRDLDWLLVRIHEYRLKDPAATLDHVESILSSPIPLREPTRLSFLVQAGELSRDLAQPERAAKHYRAFLASTQRDSRVFFIRQRLAEMEASR